MINEYFAERLALKTKFATLIGEVKILKKKKNHFRYWRLKKYMREHHDIEVSSPGLKHIKDLAEKHKLMQNTKLKYDPSKNKNWGNRLHRWNETYKTHKPKPMLDRSPKMN